VKKQVRAFSVGAKEGNDLFRREGVPLRKPARRGQEGKKGKDS